MDAVRQKCRPKHQVLVLKCYPRHQKNNVEVKPNSSELSYLLYYASTRRSKLQKVGDFLDKRTTSDVWKVRIGNVQVTLQILKALIEKTPRDLPLYSPSVLRIFRTILRSNDVTMIEETVPTFETFCAHQDPATLAADQDFIRQYEEVIRLYAAFASKDTPIQSKTAKSVPVLIRFRKAGLEAIKAIASTEILGAETGRQLGIIISPVLENIYSDKGQFLNLLEHREGEKVEIEKELAIKRRQSISTVRTTEASEPDPVAASSTTEAADKLAEQEAAVTALQALKQVFTLVPRGQLRLATSDVLRFMGARVNPAAHFPVTTQLSMTGSSWPCTLFHFICGWAPVQDRYVILVTAMETLIKSPIVEEDLEKQYLLATLIGYLLGSSDINFIGLSVMDVLVGLIQHILLVLQLGGHGANLYPHHQQVDNILEGKEFGDASRQPSPASTNRQPVVMQVAQTPSPARLQLLAQLQRCIGSLAVHIYYSDQISDMISAILSRLKPSPSSLISNTTEAIQNPVGAADAIASSVSLSEKPNTDGFFSFENARVAALESIQGIIAWANWRQSDGSPNNTARSPIRVEKWEGTQWLLRDPHWNGRVAYVEALMVWLKYELKKVDLRVPEEYHPKKKFGEKKEIGNKDSSLARRAVSNASHRDKSPKRTRHTFLQLLHLAMYENAHQYAESECDIMLLHLLLIQLMQKLGVNSVQHGLPMIMRLQEDIATIEPPTAKINLGSLVHGYLWALSVNFHFDAASTGRDIQNEISRRNNHRMWLQSIRVPPLTLEYIIQRHNKRTDVHVPDNVVQTEALKPYDKLSVLVDKIAEGYSAVLYSPPSSPPGSPNRSYSSPILALATVANSVPSIKSDNQLPPYVKDALLGEWSRDSVVAATTKSDGSRSGSLQGSGSSPTTAHVSGNKHLAVAVAAANGSVSGHTGDMPSPHRSAGFPHHAHTHLRSSRPSSAIYGLTPGNAMRDALHSRPQSRSVRSRRASHSPTQYSTTSSVRSAVRVEDLKRVLSSGGTVPFAPPSRGEVEQDTAENDNDSGSDSLVSYEDSETSYVTAPANNGLFSPGNPVIGHVSEETSGEDGHYGEAIRKEGTTEGTITPRPPTSTAAANTSARHLAGNGSAENAQAKAQGRKSSLSSLTRDVIPPVPPLPANLRSNPSTAPNSPPVLSNPSSPTNLNPDLRSSGSRSNPGSERASSMRTPSTRPRTAVSTRATGSDAVNKQQWRKSMHGAGSNVGGFSWNARDLLDDIDAEAPGSPGSLPGGRGVRVLGGRPPY